MMKETAAALTTKRIHQQVKQHWKIVLKAYQIEKYTDRLSLLFMVDHDNNKCNTTTGAFHRIESHCVLFAIVFAIYSAFVVLFVDFLYDVPLFLDLGIFAQCFLSLYRKIVAIIHQFYQ